MPYYKRVTVPLTELGNAVMELAEKYNRISVHLKGTPQHTRRGVKETMAYIIAHNV